ncbi:peptidoglycan DD-metalloendopeptidase family protein [Lysinibacillus sp. 1P01SD]|uniref:peptidoglycan DD-metalloendopeptidase family protein n=1 Tax=Lysinibacillus sp. 1P01SD TaxID=3132285 RepID=UPI0039A3C775
MKFKYAFVGILLVGVLVFSPILALIAGNVTMMNVVYDRSVWGGAFGVACLQDEASAESPDPEDGENKPNESEVPELEVAKFDEKKYKELLKSTSPNLAPLANDFINYANMYGIDPVLVTAISIHETGRGTSKAFINKKNTGGLMNPNGGGLYVFATYGESINVQAKSISNRIKEIVAEHGTFSLDKLRDKYAPLGAANDPKNLNANWLPSIVGYINELGGSADIGAFCDDVSGLVAGGWGSPTNPLVYTSSFGTRFDGFHRGVDYDCAIGDPIYAVKNGVVTRSIHHYSWGNYVKLEHPPEDGKSTTTLYAHMSKLKVKVGDVVEAGQVIGACGNTGNIIAGPNGDGSHLHLEFEVNGKLQDIRPFLKQFE